MRRISLLTAAAALVALPLAAQQPGGMMGGSEMPGMSGMMDCMMAPMMHSMATAPERLLLRKAALNLTNDQVSQLSALRDAARPVREAAAQQAMMHLKEMDDVMHTAAPDTGAVRHHFEAALRFMGDAHMTMLNAAAQARAVLTDDQRKQVDTMAASMRGRAMMRRGSGAHH